MSRKVLGLALGGAVLLGSIVLFYRIDQGTPKPGQPNDRDSTANARRGTPQLPVESADDARAPANLAATTELRALIEQALRTLATTPPNGQDAALRKLIAELRAAGPRGLQAVADFLRSGRDAPVRNAYGTSGNRVTSPSTLRVALLDALANWEGSAAVMLEFLRSPASGWEVVLAIRNLELQFPSTYRAESIAALKSALARPPDANFGDGGESHVFAAVARLGAKDLLPQAEALAVSTSNVPRYVEALADFPAETRAEALRRVLSRPELTEEITAAPQTVNHWLFQEPQVAAFIGGVFRARLAPEQRIAMLDGLDSTAPILPAEQRLFSNPQDAREGDRAANAAALREAQARKAFIAELATDPSQSSEVQAAAKDAQRRITEEIAARQTAARAEVNPLVEVDFAQGGGKAQIKGRRIEQIELQPAAVLGTPVSEDSTDSPPR
jgi:hypothetical protein